MVPKRAVVGVAVFATLCAWFLVGCAPAGEEGDEAALGLERVLSSRKIRAAFINYPPSMSVDPNSKAKSGIMVDVMNEIANAMNVSVDYVEEATFATMIDTLNSGRVDIVVSGIWPSSARALKAGFSRAVYYSAIYAYVRADDDRFDGDLGQIDDPSFRIAAIDGELSSIVAGSDYPKAVVVGLPQQADVSQLLLQLTTNKADVTFVEPAIAEAFLTKNPGSIRRVANVPAVRLFPNTFLFRRGDAQLREAINLAIVELANAGGVARIIKQYDPIGKLFTIPSLPVSP